MSCFEEMTINDTYEIEGGVDVIGAVGLGIMLYGLVRDMVKTAGENAAYRDLGYK